MFQKVDAYAGDPILSLMERFKEDPRSDKVNLSIGLYYNEDGIIPQLKAVAEAEARLNAVPHGASLYLPMEGLNAYRNTIAPLLFGADHAVLAQKRVATIQTLGGSGALKVGADFLKKYFPDSGVWVSDPTWENHVAIFEGAGFKVATYPWFDSETNGVRVDALLEKLNTLPERSIVLLHPCCHNPTGADLTNAQWDAVIEVLKARNLIPFLDIAYQGFGAGMEEDAYAIRAVASAGLPVLVSNSFSKIFSLYGERVGGLSVVCEDAEAAGRVLGQLKATVRRIYSSPPNFGAQVVATSRKNGKARLRIANTSLSRSASVTPEKSRLRARAPSARLVSPNARRLQRGAVRRRHADARGCVVEVMRRACSRAGGRPVQRQSGMAS